MRVRFLIIGGIAAACYVSTMTLMVDVVGTSATTGSVFGFAVGTIVSYVGNSLLTFEAPLSSASVFVVVSNVAIASSLERLGVHYMMISLVILVIVPAQNFILHEMWTFRQKDA